MNHPSTRNPRAAVHAVARSRPMRLAILIAAVALLLSALAVSAAT